MKLRDLLDGLGAHSVSGPADTEIASIAYHSRQVAPGTLFVAIRGEKADGNRYVVEAIERGAVAVVSEQPQREMPPSVAWVQVPNARRALAVLAANYYGRPAAALKMVGITGTNGKTTTTYLVDSVLRAAGVPSGMLGTVEYRLPGTAEKAKFTTPESLELHQFFARVRRAGGTHVNMEVSSHALAMERVWGCRFEVAAFTNLTSDHLDFHRTLEDYFAAKRRLFTGSGAAAPAVAVLNADDPRSKALAGLAGRTLTFGLEGGDVAATKRVALSFNGLEFAARTPAGKIEVRSPLVGRINVYNLLAAAAVGIALGLDAGTIEKGLAQLSSVPGRFQRVDAGQPFLVVIDYAHTDDAYRNLIATARELNPGGRIIFLFGCGGDRDRTKRPLMGETAGRLSDLVILTTDNPRSEDPLRTINDALVGVQKTSAKYVVEPDRERAIGMALEEARAGDIVLLAGKGHETYQILRDRTMEFHEREIVLRWLAERGFGKVTC